MIYYLITFALSATLWVLVAVSTKPKLRPERRRHALTVSRETWLDVKRGKRRLIEGEEGVEYGAGDWIDLFPSTGKRRRWSYPIQELRRAGSMRPVLSLGAGIHREWAVWGLKWCVAPLALAVAMVASGLVGTIYMLVRTGYPEPPHVREDSTIFDMREDRQDKRWRVCIYYGDCPRYWTLDSLRWAGTAVQNKVASMLQIGIRASGDDCRTAAMRPGAFTHRINAANSSKAAELLRKLVADANQTGARIELVAILDHGEPAGQHLGDALISDQLLTACHDAVYWDGSIGLVLLGCNVASGRSGLEYIRLVSKLYRLTVYASSVVVREFNGDESESKQRHAVPGSLRTPDIWKAVPGADPIHLPPKYARQLLHLAPDLSDDAVTMPNRP